MRVFLLSHVSNYWTPLYARAFQDRGHDVLAASFDEGSIEGIASTCVGVQPWQEHKIGHVTRAWKVRRLINRFAPDVVCATYVISNGLTAALAGARPLVVSAHGYDLLVDAAYSGLGRRARRAVLAWVCRRADAVHVVSDEMVQAAIGLGARPERVACIPVGIRLASFPPRPASSPKAVPHILCTRRHEPIYDNETIIDALARLAASGQRFSATLAGPGPLTSRYRDLVQARGLADSVAIVGALDHAAIPGLLAGSDVFVSASRVDGTSSALLEALAVGLVPVVSDIAANRAWVDHGSNGLLFPPGDAAALAEALGRAVGDAALIERARVTGRARVERDGDLDRNLDRLTALLVGVAEDARR